MRGKVLVIDDSLMVREQVGRALTGAGFVTIDACDGRDAMLKVAANPDIRLAICDLTMPVMNGLEFLEHLRTEGHALPVLMLTADGQPELIQRARSLGAKGWIVKPFKPEQLVAAAKKLTAAAA